MDTKFNEIRAPYTKEEFQKHLSAILDRLVKIVPHRQILVLTIPDFSVSPVGPEYSQGRDISKGLQEFNQIILEEAQNYHLKVMDLYSLSQTFAKDPSMFSQDGLHPSAKGYAKWADHIEPVFEQLLQ